MSEGKKEGTALEVRSMAEAVAKREQKEDPNLQSTHREDVPEELQQNVGEEVQLISQSSEEKDFRDGNVSDGRMDIPSYLLSAIAGVWQKCLIKMKKDGLFQGEIPENFMAEGSLDGGLILRVVHMPKGIISVPKDGASFERFISESEEGMPKGRTRPKLSGPSRRKITVEDDGNVSVEGK